MFGFGSNDTGSRGGLVWLQRLRSSKHDQHDDAKRDEKRRDELRGRQYVEHRATRVTSVKLDEETSGRVEEQIRPEHLTREQVSPALVEEEEAEDQERST